MELIVGALTIGLAYAFLSMGVFITMRIFNFPDITADGSLTLGGAITAALVPFGVEPWLAVGLSMVGGFAAGALTGVIHTKLRVNGLLAGILVMTALYSVNLRIMGQSNVPLWKAKTIVSSAAALTGMADPERAALLLFLVMTAIGVAALAWFLHTDFGLAMRATGDNESMIAAQGVDTDRMKIIGIGISNALIALCGTIVAQYQVYSDIGMGVGIVVFGLASVIIGDTLASAAGRESITARIVAVIGGSIVFRAIVGLTLWIGVRPSDLKLATAVFVLAAILLPRMRRGTSRNAGLRLG